MRISVPYQHEEGWDQERIVLIKKQLIQDPDWALVSIVCIVATESTVDFSSQLIPTCTRCLSVGNLIKQAIFLAATRTN